MGCGFLLSKNHALLGHPYGDLLTTLFSHHLFLASLVLFLSLNIYSPPCMPGVVVIFCYFCQVDAASQYIIQTTKFSAYENKVLTYIQNLLAESPR